MAVSVAAAVVWRGWPSITFGDMAEQPRDIDATGIVIDPHRWSDPQVDEWEWPDEEERA